MSYLTLIEVFSSEHSSKGRLVVTGGSTVGNDKASLQISGRENRIR